LRRLARWRSCRPYANKITFFFRRGSHQHVIRGSWYLYMIGPAGLNGHPQLFARIRRARFNIKGNMNQMNTYLIRLRGQVDVTDLNPMSPHQLTAVHMAPASTLICISTDQSGLLGMLVHLHNLGLTFLSVQQDEKDALEKDHEYTTGLTA
jgi:hypothetical protein